MESPEMNMFSPAEKVSSLEDQININI